MPGRISRACLASATLLVLAFGHAAAQSPTPRSASSELVAVEIRFLAVPLRLVDEFLKVGSPATLDDAKLREVLGAVEGDLRASVLQSVKVTATGGQRSALRVDGANCAGIEVSVLPVVSADRRSVRVALKAELLPLHHWFEAMQPKDGQAIAVTETFTTPEGRTVVFAAGTRTQTVRDTEKIPVLGDVPYLGLLFTKASTRVKEERILILVTPRILLQGPGEHPNN